MKTSRSHADYARSLDYIYRQKKQKGLGKFISDLFDVKIPHERICPNHQSPLEFVAETFYDDDSTIIALANRSGGKTMNFSILDVLNSYYHQNCETATVGAIEEQAKKCYRYFQNWIMNKPIFAEQVISTLISRTDWSNGSMVQILTGTVQSVNSPHPNKAFIDEIDLMKWDVLQEALSMAKSSDTIHGQTILTSTRKYAGGVMDTLLENARKRGIRTFQWCIWEVVEPYPHDDSELCKEIELLFPEMPDEIRTKTSGFYKWRDLIAKRKNLDDDVWESQWLCTKPQRSGLMYPQFEASLYPKGNIEQHAYDRRLPLYVFEDFGFGEDHPNVNLFVQANMAMRKLHIFDELYLTAHTSDEVVKKVVEKLKEHGIKIVYDTVRRVYKMQGIITGWVPDPAGLVEIAERVKLGVPILEKVEEPELYKIINGAPLLRTMFKARDIRIDPRCGKLIEELLNYKKKRLPSGDFSDQPEKKNDHGPDGLRYGAIRLFPTTAYESIGTEIEQGVQPGVNITGGLLDMDF